MDAFLDPLVERVVLMFAAQLGKSEAILNLLFYHIHQDPAPVMLVQPREFDAKKFSKSRIAPAIRDTPVLRGLVSDPKSRDSDNTILQKNFPGGRLIMVGANAPAGLAGDPIRVALLDEVDRFPLSAGGEGDPIELVEKRTTTFADAKLSLTSTPTDESTSRIKQAYLNSDQRRHWVPCPHCNMEQILVWTQVSWDKDEDGKHLPDTAAYVCEHCGVPWTEPERHRAIQSGRWIAQEEFNGTAGFWLNGLNGLWHALRLSRMARKFLETKDRPHLLRTFRNTYLAETWVDEARVAPAGLLGRCEEYPTRKNGLVLVPKGALVLTAGVDIQDDRIECQICGWGLDDERWMIQYHVLDGDPTGKDVWNSLWQLLTTPLPMERGGADFIRATAIDTGYLTQRVYDFCRPRHKLNMPDGRRGYVFAIKGRGAVQGDIWPRVPNLRTRGRVPLYSVYVDPAKEQLYQTLSVVEAGPGYVHFPLQVSSGRAFDQGYFDQLDSEVCVLGTDKKGFQTKTWKLKHEMRRNEAFDTALYAHAAYLGLVQMGFNLERYGEQAEALQRTTADEDGRIEDLDLSPQAPAPAGSNPGQKRRRQRIVRSNWMDR